MEPITLNVWVDPETHKAAEKPIKVEFSDTQSLESLRDSGLKFSIRGPETPDRDNYSYSGNCCYCKDLIRKEIELDFFSENDRIHTFHRECLELYMLGGSHAV
jgi:hypothetical protein